MFFYSGQLSAFSEASLVRHQCVGNVICLQTYPTAVHIIAATAIKKGKILYRNLHYTGAILQGPERQQLAKELTGKLCECACCTDPSNKEDNLSAILCLKCKRRGFEKYMVPADTMDLETPWKCQKCSAVKTFAQVQKLYNDAIRELQCDVPGNRYELEVRLRSIVYKYKRDSPLHACHAIILSAESEIIFLMLARLQYLTLEETDYLMQLMTTRMKVASKFVPVIHSSLGKIMEEVKCGEKAWSLV